MCVCLLLLSGFPIKLPINVAINQKSGDKSISIGDKNKKRILEYLSTHKEDKSQEIAEMLGLGISRTKV